MSKTTRKAVRANASVKPQPMIAGLASLMGTTIEWYDYFLYGTAAALIFNKIFFPDIDPVTGTLAAFATYAVGFFARPFGGIVFGHFGDRLGRKSMLLITLFMMGIPTIVIGLIPSYSSIGYWAAVLLVAMRLLQGIAVGGEWGGAVLLAVEHAPTGKKGLFGSLPQTGVASGLILSSLAMGAVARLPEEDMLSWGWRIPFLASTALLLIGWWIREKVAESPDFVAVQHTPRTAAPLRAVLRDHPLQLVAVAGARLAEVTWFYTVATFSLAYATKTLNLPKAAILNAVVWGAAVAMVTMPVCGSLGDKFGQRRMFALGTAGLIVFAPVFFYLLQTRDLFWVTTAMVIAIGVVYSLLYGPEGALFSAQFKPQVRYTGISVGVQVSGAIGGGLAPMIATTLLAYGDGDPFFIYCYLMGLGILALGCLALMKAVDPERAPVLAPVHLPAAAK